MTYYTMYRNQFMAMSAISALRASAGDGHEYGHSEVSPVDRELLHPDQDDPGHDLVGVIVSIRASGEAEKRWHRFAWIA